MPVGILDPNAGMIAQDLNGLTGAGYTTDAEGRRIDGRRVLDTYSPVNNGQFLSQFDGLFNEDFANQQGFGDLWRTGYSGAINNGFDAPENRDATFSPELLNRLSQYQVARLGFGDDMRQYAVLGQDGNVVSASEPRARNNFLRDTLIGMAALTGGAALNGAFGGAAAAGEGAAAAGAAEGAGAAAAGSAGDIALSGLLPVETVASTASLPSLAQVGGGAGLLGAATNPALIESAVGTAGYGASSAGAGNALGIGAGGLGMTGAQTSAYDALIGATGSPGLANAGSNLVGSDLGRATTGITSWLRDNPTLGRLLFSAGSGLLSGVGGSSGGGSQQPLGPARQWSSPLQQGIIQDPLKTNIASPLSFKGRW
jgi:hypothetical protein